MTGIAPIWRRRSRTTSASITSSNRWLMGNMGTVKRTGRGMEWLENWSGGWGLDDCLYLLMNVIPLYASIYIYIYSGPWICTCFVGRGSRLVERSTCRAEMYGFERPPLRRLYCAGISSRSFTHNCSVLSIDAWSLQCCAESFKWAEVVKDLIRSIHWKMSRLEAIPYCGHTVAI